MQPENAPRSLADSKLDSCSERLPTTHNRRAFLLAGIGLLLAGCGGKTRSVTTLPGPVWPYRPLPSAQDEVPAPSVPSSPATVAFEGVLTRSQWAGGQPVPSLMDRMLPVQYVTVHHDGMDPFYGTDARSTAARLEAIRRAHRNKGWGDIGYHFAVDREGRVWEGRPLAWQGAHVKNHNEGNIGVVALGNFDRQTPTPAQLQALNRIVSHLLRRYNVPLARLKTHQEWSATACPGINLQRYMITARNNRQFG